MLSPTRLLALGGAVLLLTPAASATPERGLRPKVEAALDAARSKSQALQAALDQAPGLPPSLRRSVARTLGRTDAFVRHPTIEDAIVTRDTRMNVDLFGEPGARSATILVGPTSLGHSLEVWRQRPMGERHDPLEPMWREKESVTIHADGISVARTREDRKVRERTATPLLGHLVLSDGRQLGAAPWLIRTRNDRHAYVVDGQRIVRLRDEATRKLVLSSQQEDALSR